MANTTASDMLMYFVEKPNGTPISAESTASLTQTDDRHMTGFAAGKYFDAENFSFGMVLKDEEGDGEKDQQDAKNAGKKVVDTESRSYARWRALEGNPQTEMEKFKAEPYDASVTRLIDSSSPLLLKHCLNTTQFHQAVIVKRSRIGATGLLSVILRMEFSKVFIRGIQWQDGNTVSETCSFRFSEVKITYVRRRADGTGGAALPCEWKVYVPPV